MADNYKYDEPGPGTTMASDDVGGVQYPRVKVCVGADGTGTDVPGDATYGMDVDVTRLPYQTREDTYTTTANGTTVTFSTPCKSFSLQCRQTGTVTSWDVRLEVSLDNTNWIVISIHTKAASGDGGMLFASPFPALYVRTRCHAITLGGGTNVKAVLLAIPF